MVKADMAIIGGGPAGLATAIAARRKGLSVAVFDGARPSGEAPAIDKCCGEGLMPGALDALHEMGADISPGEGAALAGIRFLDQRYSAEARFPFGHGLALRRTALHGMLVEHARACGVSLNWNAPLKLDDVSGFRWVIGADGMTSAVRRAAGLDRGRAASRRFGFRQHFRMTPWSEFVEVYWGPRAQAYVTPVSDNEIGVALIAGGEHTRYSDLVQMFPQLGARLQNAPQVSTVRGSVTMSRSFKRVTKGNVALLGDASGSVDAITGEGLCLAFQQALALADAVSNGRLVDYEMAHRRIFRTARFMSRLLLTMDRHEWFRRRAMAALAAEPAQFSRLLAVHVGALGPAEAVLSAPFTLARRFLTA